MPRQSRKKSEIGIYHVMLRGINRQQIFEETEDYEKFLQVLQDCKAVCGFKIFAYCLMGNHIHLLIQPNNEPLELIVKRLGCRFVYWYNWKYRRSGHLFQDRYKSETVEDDSYFLTVLRYIHNNPVNAHLCGDMYSYTFSSAHYYLNDNDHGLIDADFVFDLLSKDQLLEYFNEDTNEVCMDISENYRLNDEEAVNLIYEVSGSKNPAKIQNLDLKERNRVLAELKSRGLSIRQISRLTGISFNIVRKF